MCNDFSFTENEKTKKYTFSRRKGLAEKDFKNWFTKAKNFYKCFELMIREEDYGLAAFQLHQTTEFCYKAIIKTFIHEYPEENDLGVLRFWVVKQDKRFDKILPCDNSNDLFLFKQFSKAYVGGRYMMDDYKNSATNLGYFCKEVKKLIKITEEICQERINYYANDGKK